MLDLAAFALCLLIAVVLIRFLPRQEQESSRVEVEERVENWSWPERRVGPEDRVRLP